MFPFLPVQLPPRCPWKFEARRSDGHDLDDEDPGEAAQRRHVQREVLWWKHVGPGRNQGEPDLAI